MRMIENVARVAAPVLIAMFTTGVVSACPTCTEGLGQNDPQGQAIAAGFYYSILFMMAMPFTILATFGSVAYFSIRRAQKANEAGSIEAEDRTTT